MGTLRPGRQRSSGAPEAGWTLIELLVVLSLIMILMSVAFSSRANARQMSREAALRADLQMMRDAIDQFYADTTRYPESLQELVTSGYMRFIPKDPFTDSSATWQTELPPTGLFAGGRPRNGVFQVRSGSTATSLRGVRVSQW